MPRKLPRVDPNGEFVLKGSAWNDLCNRIEWLEGLTVATGSGLEIHRQPAGPVLAARIISRAAVWAKLTQRSGDDDRIYAWTQAIPISTGWELVEGGTVGTLEEDFAFDDTEEIDRLDLTNKYVLLIPRVPYKQPDEQVLICRKIVHNCEQKPQKQWMVRSGVTQNTLGYGYLAAHPNEPNPAP